MDTYEQKYKDALEKLRSLHDDYDTVSTLIDIKEELENIFPELRETEDERIRKEFCEDIWTFIPNEKAHKYIAWLEKQGQKPIDTIKSKFKQGDWIIFNGLILHIDEVVDGYYRTTSIGGIHNSYDWDIDNIARLWTIQEAKDGDVLAFDNDTIVIFKDLYNSTTFHSYCHIEDGEFGISEDGMPDWWKGKGFQPATKEQRDLLFQKMREEGYEWDAEKKELKKIEEEYDGEEYGIDSLFHAQRILEKTLGKVDGYQTDDGILSHKCAISAVKKLYENGY